MNFLSGKIYTPLLTSGQTLHLLLVYAHIMFTVMLIHFCPI